MADIARWNTKWQNGETCIGKINTSCCYIGSRNFSKWEKWWPKYSTYHSYTYMGATYLMLLQFYIKIAYIAAFVISSSHIYLTFDWQRLIWYSVHTFKLFKTINIRYDSGWFWNSNCHRKTMRWISAKLISSMNSTLQTWAMRILCGYPIMTMEFIKMSCMHI